MMQKIHNELIARGQKLIVAESCTGGAVAAMITAIPGASRYFLGSIVAYQAEEKQRWLHVKAETIKKFGLVSCAIAREMAQGVMQGSSADYALGVTGSAGPTVQEGSELGKICFAIVAKSGQTKEWSVKFQGTRKEIVEQSVLELLTTFYKLFFS